MLAEHDQADRQRRRHDEAQWPPEPRPEGDRDQKANLGHGQRLAPDVAYYQRLLAGDQSEAAELIDKHVTKHPGETVYDALLLPSLTYAERDRAEGRLSAEEERGDRGSHPGVDRRRRDIPPSPPAGH